MLCNTPIRPRAEGRGGTWAPGVAVTGVGVVRWGEARSHSTSAGLTTQKSRSTSDAAQVCSARSMRSKRDGITWDPWPWLKNSRQRRFGNAAA